METINKLLQKQAPKRRTRAEIMAANAAAGSGYEGGEDEPANPLYVRYINNSQGSRIAVPVEWLDSPLGATLRTGWTGPAPRKMVEVEEVA